MLSPTTMVDFYSLVINGDHKIRLVIIKIKCVEAMVVVFTKLNICSTTRALDLIKKGEKGGPLSYLYPTTGSPVPQLTLRRSLQSTARLLCKPPC